jgi:hypothetical protein
MHDPAQLAPGVPEDTSYGTTDTPRARTGRRGRSRRWGDLLAKLGLGVCLVIIAGAPLAVGVVHRPLLIGWMVAGAVAITCLSVGLWYQHRELRIGWAVAIPLVLLLIPLLQSVPMPMSLRSRLDPNGTELLRVNDTISIQSWPFSLDPPATRVQIGRAALALVVFLAAFHMASGRRWRHVLLRTLGVAGIAAVAIALGHRMFGVAKLYGMFATVSRTPLIGPFVNSNHTAEFLELAAFVCLACAFQRQTALNRVGWLAGTFLCMGGALATLSRGAVLALAASVLTFALFQYLARDGAAKGHRRKSLAWGIFLLALIALGFSALGANRLVERFRPDAINTDMRLRLWRDSLHVLAAHPLGIGRGAFETVFPVYRELKSGYSVRFAYVENEPLQLLIDSGWPMFALFGVALGVAFVQLLRRGRRDPVEAALAAGLAAVTVHSFVDFGLETLGVLLPFTAVLAVLLGRLRDPAQRSAARPAFGLAAFAALAAIIGALSTAHASNDNIDAALKASTEVGATKRLLARAQATHPLDYFYPLAQARFEPLRAVNGGPSPRLHTLNLSLRLCPNCEQVHAEVARNLWALGKRTQALLEWRYALSIQAALFDRAIGELFAGGATPAQLAAVASFDVSRMVDVANFLNGQMRMADALTVLDQADSLGANRVDSLIVRARLQLHAGQVAAAQATLAAADGAHVQDPRLFFLKAEATMAARGEAGVEEALATLDTAATRFPFDVEVQRARMRLVLDHKRWQASARAVAGLQAALYRAHGTASEAHVAAARVQAGMGHLTAALAEYRIALTDEPGNVALWVEFGRTAQQGGRPTIAREAFLQASHLSPHNPEITTLLHDTDQDVARLRSSLHGTPPAPELAK